MTGRQSERAPRAKGRTVHRNYQRVTRPLAPLTHDALMRAHVLPVLSEIIEHALFCALMHEGAVVVSCHENTSETLRAPVCAPQVSEVRSPVSVQLVLIVRFAILLGP